MRIIGRPWRDAPTSARPARELGLGRPLLHMHLQRLEAAGLVIGSLEAAKDGETMKYVEVASCFFELPPPGHASPGRARPGRAGLGPADGPHARGRAEAGTAFVTHRVIRFILDVTGAVPYPPRAARSRLTERHESQHQVSVNTARSRRGHCEAPRSTTCHTSSDLHNHR
ncbi:hypothetical protein STSP_56600 [Streptomyces jeddahensis]|uniref:Bacterial regulatory protein, arsR family n=1 Tax=Streptomyces jeddahensis TaxID=1716141 RepID=A0A177HJW8_9ACTN|nr:hypothetical protein STSP_56600 [Streptomyces jeddahensis]